MHARVCTCSRAELGAPIYCPAHYKSRLVRPAGGTNEQSLPGLPQGARANHLQAQVWPCSTWLVLPTQPSDAFVLLYKPLLSNQMPICQGFSFRCHGRPWFWQPQGKVIFSQSYQLHGSCFISVSKWHLALLFCLQCKDLSPP